MRKYTPIQVTLLSGWTADQLRDLRRRGLLAEFGERSDRSRWRFTLQDVIALDVANILSCELGQKLSFPCSRVLAERVHNAAKGARVPPVRISPTLYVDVSAIADMLTPTLKGEIERNA